MGQRLSSLTNRTPVRPMTPRTENFRAPDDDPWELWENLRSSSTLHGFSLASESKCSVRRIAWVIILLSTCGILFYQLKGNIDKWKQFEVLFSTEFEVSKSLPFPAVSICNQNIMRKSKIKGKDGQRYVDSLSGPNMTSKQADHGNSGPFDIEQEVRLTGHDLAEMLHYCKFSELHCTAEEFVPFLNFKHGLCYTFNSARDLRPVHQVFYYGADYGLSILLDAQPEEYYGYYSHEGTGFKIVVHDQKRMPWMGGDGLAVSPGFTTNIKVKRKELSRLPSPYKSHCGNRSLVSSQDYSKTRCETECFAREAITRCRCRPLGTPEGYESAIRTCSTEQDINCAYRVYETTSLQECDCPYPCEDVQYSTEVSTLYFPSRPVLDDLVQYNKKHNKEHYEYYNSQYIKADYDDYVERESRKSLVQINIYYETLANTVVKERPAYTFNDVVADFGGNMGLFVGCSLLTLVEFVDFLVLVCLALWRRRRRPQPTDPEIAA